MLQTALLVLSLSAAGEVQMSLSIAQDAAQCQGYHALVTAVMANAGRQVLVARCGETSKRLSAFRHGAQPQEYRHAWRVTVPAPGGYVLEPLEPRAPCAPAPQTEPAVYCARSAQQALE